MIGLYRLVVWIGCEAPMNKFTDLKNMHITKKLRSSEKIMFLSIENMGIVSG